MSKDLLRLVEQKESLPGFEADLAKKGLLSLVKLILKQARIIV